MRLYQFVIYILYFTIVGLFAVCVFTLTKWGGMLHTYLFFYCVANLVYNVGYINQLHTTDMTTYINALKLGYFGRLWVGLSMALFIAELCGKTFPAKLKIGAGIYNMIVYFFILNLEKTRLYYRTMEFKMVGDFPTLPHSGGPIYYIYTSLNLFYAIFCIVLIVQAYVREKNKTAKNRDLFLMISIIALVSTYVIYFFKLIELARIFDIMILGYALCTAFMLIAIVKFRMLDTTAAAKNYVVDELSEGIIVVDDENKVSYYNKPAQKLFPALSDPDGSAEAIRSLLNDFDSSISSGKPVRMGERIYTPRANPLTDAGTRIGTLYSLSDDSEHYRYMDELREQKQIADNANEAKSQFLANMSHEIRTPINAVLGFNEMISRECEKLKDTTEEKSPAVSEAFENISTFSGNIEGAGNNLLSIINDILDLSKIEAGKMELIDGEYSLASLLRDVNGMIMFRASEKELGFITDVDETLPDKLCGDMVRVRQVMTNILTNAVKYTDSGNVKLTVRAKEDSVIKAGGTLNLIVTVTDTGIGIRPEDMEKLFGSFERLELKRNSTIEGTGLGLSISHQLVSMMGGNISVKSEYGSGSTFVITIPQKISSVEPVGNFSVSAANSDKAKKPYKVSFSAADAVILVVDDSIVNLRVAKALLRDTGLIIDTADSGNKALEMTLNKKYDLVLMDQRMPNMDGTEALKNIRAQHEGPNTETPVICMTADAIIGSKEKYINAGFDDYLSKPVKSEQLEQTLIKYLPQEKISI